MKVTHSQHKRNHQWCDFSRWWRTGMRKKQESVRDGNDSNNEREASSTASSSSSAITITTTTGSSETSIRDKELLLHPRNTSIFWTMRKLCSLSIIFTCLMIVALVVVVVVISTTTIVSGRSVVLDLGVELRKVFARQASQTVNQIFQTTNANLESLAYVSTTNWRSLESVFLPNSTAPLNRYLNILRAEVNKERSYQLIDVQLKSGNILAWERNVDSMVSYAFYVLDNTTVISVYNLTTGDLALVYNSSAWQPFPHMHELMASNTDVISLSQVFKSSVSRKDIIELYKPFVNSQDGVYATLSLSVGIDDLERTLSSVNPTQNETFIVVVDRNGLLVASSLPYSFANNEMRTLNHSNNQELLRMNEAVLKGSGWANLNDMNNIEYHSRSFGKITVSWETLQFPNTDLYVLVAWPITTWTDKVTRNTWINLGVSLAVLTLAVIVTLLITIPIVRGILQINSAFNETQQMQLDSKLIHKLTRKKYLCYETAQLQKSLSLMVSSLDSFQKYVPSHVVKQIVNGQEPKLALTRCDASVFFLDIENFTHLSEMLSPDDLIQVMSEAFEKLSDVIAGTYQGIIDKYIGDCIMAFWKDPDHQVSACRAALDCRSAIVQLGHVFNEKGLPSIHCRMGINSGNVLLGNFGSTHRYNYTVLGDDVNIASRAESMNKMYMSVIIVTENTHDALISQAPDVFISRRLDRVQVKGREQSTLLFELLGYRCETSDEELQNLAQYEMAMEHYFAGNFDQARNLFQQIPTHETDVVIQKKIQQCQEYSMVTGGGGAWTGVLRMNSK